MKQRPPVLVFAQSGRFIAEAAALAGYPVRVADCFCDSDTQAVAEKISQLPALDQLSQSQLRQVLISLSQNEPCLLLYGTGIERFYPILADLPSHITVIGNTRQTISLLRQAHRFFALLEQLQIPYPPTSLSKPTVENPLRKRLDSAGGSAVFADKRPLSPGEFYQQQIKGETHSVCFIANGQDVTILGWNQQFNQSEKFVIQQIWQRDEPPVHAPQLSAMLIKLVTASRLVGINSLDYLISTNGNIYILEINPRISASVALLPTADWLKWHMDSCRHQSLPDITLMSDNLPVRLMHYCYADSNLVVVDEPVWPACCHDLPTPGSYIKKGEPICSLLLASDSAQACNDQLTGWQQKLLKNCLRVA